MGIFGTKRHQSDSTHLHWVPWTFFFEVKELLDWTYGWNWSKAPPKSFYISTEFQGHVFGNHRVIRMNPWIELVQSTPKLYYTSSLSSKENSSGKKRVIKMNLWVELVESTTKAILHIFTEFQGHFSGNQRVIRMNLWVKLVQSATKVILHKFTKFQGHFSANKRVSRMNS